MRSASGGWVAPEAAEIGLEGLGDEEVADLAGVRVDHGATEGVAADLLEGAGDAARVAGELHSRGIGEKLALARHRGLDEPAEEITHITDEQ